MENVLLQHLCRGNFMQKKILVVDPHLGASSNLSELLRQQGYLVEQAGEGEKALSTIRHEKYAVIISDVLSDGLRVVENAKRVSPAVPVILMSNEHLLTRNEAIQLGAYELIEKSDLAFEQLNKIQRVLERTNEHALGAVESETIRKVA
jgi:two-component system response regulator MprA